MYAANRDVLKKVVYGESVLGQDLVAYRTTKGDKSTKRKPVVLYNAVQHAREWIAAETNRRLFEYFLDHKRDPSSGIPSSCAPPRCGSCRSSTGRVRPHVRHARHAHVAQEPARQQRRRRDHGRERRRRHEPQLADDVALRSRGASDNPVSETYRGTAPASEPEVAAYRALQQQIDAEFMIDFHSYGELILYPEGWQVETQATDNPILERSPVMTSCVRRSQATTRTCRRSSTPSTATSPTTRCTATGRRRTRSS